MISTVANTYEMISSVPTLRVPLWLNWVYEYESFLTTEGQEVGTEDTEKIYKFTRTLILLTSDFINTFAVDPAKYRFKRIRIYDICDLEKIIEAP